MAVPPPPPGLDVPQTGSVYRWVESTPSTPAFTQVYAIRGLLPPFTNVMVVADCREEFLLLTMGPQEGSA